MKIGYPACGEPVRMKSHKTDLSATPRGVLVGAGDLSGAQITVKTLSDGESNAGLVVQRAASG